MDCLQCGTKCVERPSKNRKIKYFCWRCNRIYSFNKIKYGGEKNAIKKKNDKGD